MEPGPCDPEGKKPSNPNARNGGWIPTAVGKKKGHPESRFRGKRPEARVLEAVALAETPVVPGPALLSGSFTLGLTGSFPCSLGLWNIQQLRMHGVPGLGRTEGPKAL